MAQKTMTSCQSQISAEESADILYNFMKSAEDTELDNNRQVQGLNPDAYGDPPTREEKDETSEALWGQHDTTDNDPSGTAQHHSNAVWEGFREGRERFIKRNFDSFEPSRDQTNKLLSQSFQHYRSGDHESSKPYTNDHSDRTPPVVETVLDKTKKLLDQ